MVITTNQRLRSGGADRFPLASRREYLLELDQGSTRFRPGLLIILQYNLGLVKKARYDVDDPCDARPPPGYAPFFTTNQTLSS